MSASDDRTVRLWTLALSSHNDEDSQQQQQQQHEVKCLQAAQVLYGHTSRLWDCQFGEEHGILVTASEDCTARYVTNLHARAIKGTEVTPTLLGILARQLSLPLESGGQSLEHLFSMIGSPGHNTPHPAVCKQDALCCIVNIDTRFCMCCLCECNQCGCIVKHHICWPMMCSSSLCPPALTVCIVTNLLEGDVCNQYKILPAHN
jgi:WD40 repeat protein